MSDVNLNLRASSEKGDEDGVRRALEQDAEVNSTTKHGMTALHFASIQGHDSIAAILLQSKADPNLQNLNGQTALELAAVKGHKDVVKLLLEAGCDVNRKTKFSGMTALHLASKNAHEAIIKLLLSHKADEGILDEIKKPPVYYAGNEITARLFQHPYDSRILRATLKDKKITHEQETSNNNVALPLINISDENGSRSGTELPNQEVDGSDQYKTLHDKTVISRNASPTRPPNERRKKGTSRSNEQSPNASQSYDRSPNASPSRSPNRMSTDPDNDSKQKKGAYGSPDHGETRNHVKNHKMEYSEEHKKRMKLNVFDRLMGGKK